MKLYVIHHAEAKREEEDPNRPLTDKGCAEGQRVAARLVERGEDGRWVVRWSLTPDVV